MSVGPSGLQGKGLRAVAQAQKRIAGAHGVALVDSELLHHAGHFHRQQSAAPRQHSAGQHQPLLRRCVFDGGDGYRRLVGP
ncbi:hypothetical protein [Immundisolibacter sp.]